jgi:hypothetical protein
VPAIHDDVDRRIRARSVLPEGRVAVDRSRDLQAQLLVEARDRQHFDLIPHFRHAGNGADLLGDITLLVRHRDLARERDHALVDDAADVIEYRVLRIHVDLPCDLVGDSRVVAILGHCRRAGTNDKSECNRSEDCPNRWSARHLCSTSTSSALGGF